MAFPRNSLRAFLQYAKTNIYKAVHEEHEINIVVGNESAGLLLHCTKGLGTAILISTRP